MINTDQKIDTKQNMDTRQGIDTGQILKNCIDIIDSSGTRDEKLLAICELLDSKVSVFDWTGFYLASEEEENMLILGPYIGEPTDHVKIPFGRGICGQVAETLETFVVQDVSLEGNYLSCSVDVKSEIVVPIMKDEKFVGELDIDSHTKHAISDELTALCEEICNELPRIF